MKTMKQQINIEVEKYGMTCQVEEDGIQCDTRPESQTRYFNTHPEDPYFNGTFDYQWSWIPYAYEVTKDVAIMVERSLTGAYIITNNGALPKLHKLPCFKKVDDWSDINAVQERINRVKKYFEEMVKKYGAK